MSEPAHFTQYVGVSPGTTTMNLGGSMLGALTCPPDLRGLGVCPPGYYGQDIMLPGAANMGPAPTPGGGPQQALNPYATESKLEGLRGVRWDYIVGAFGVAFAGVLGFALWKRSRK